MNPIAVNINLEDGNYKGYFHSWILEINGEEFPTLIGG